jgi:hypothetical protein
MCSATRSSPKVAGDVGLDILVGHEADRLFRIALKSGPVQFGHGRAELGFCRRPLGSSLPEENRSAPPAHNHEHDRHNFRPHANLLAVDTAH